MSVPQNWYSKSAEGILGAIWVANPLKVMLMKPTFVPDRDVQLVYADISAQEVAAGGGYATGGITLANKSVTYDSASDTSHLYADDVSWGPTATFDARYAVVYDSSGAKVLWSLIDFQATKSVTAGVFTLDFDALGLLDVVAA